MRRGTTPTFEEALLTEEELAFRIRSKRSPLPQTTLSAELSPFSALTVPTASDIQERMRRRQNIQAIYRQRLIEKAYAKLDRSTSLREIRFDPQEHVLIEAEMTPNDYAEVLRLADETPPENNAEAKKKLEGLIGEVSDSVYCNLDVKGRFEKLFLTAMIIHQNLDVNESETLSNALRAFMNSESRSSITSFQEEMEMHMQLLSRVLQEKIGNAITKEQWQSIRLQAAQKINKLVKTKFLQGLTKSYNEDTGSLDIYNINKTFDEYRKQMGRECESILIQTCIDTEYGVGLKRFSALFGEHVQDKLQKSDFEATPALSCDYLKTMHDQELVVAISGTPNTAHDKRLGPDTLAFRRVGHSLYQLKDGKVIVSALNHLAIEARVPSIAVVFDETVTYQESIQDVAEKFAWAYTEFQQELSGTYEAPIIYNLLTSIPTKFADNTIENKNRQRESAKRILQGMHLYNQSIANNPAANKGFFYVQNIPVNQHTQSLSFAASDNVVVEATLMSEIAALYTLLQHRDSFPADIAESIAMQYRAAHKLYCQFLGSSKTENAYFKDSAPGKELIAGLIDFNEKIRRHLQEREINSNELHGKIAIASLKMLSQDAYLNPQFGMLIQALSIFLEPISMEGCKSANERYLAVKGRVELLRSIEERQKNGSQLSDQEKQIITALDGFIRGDMPLDALQTALDTAYNLHELQGGANAICSIDTGSASALRSTKNTDPLNINEFNTNVGETGLVDNLAANHAKKGQTHKWWKSEHIAEFYENSQCLFAEAQRQHEAQTASLVTAGIFNRPRSDAISHPSVDHVKTPGG